MKAEIISIGTEIMLGEIIDTNSSFIAQKFTDIGYEINFIINVPDKKDQLEDVLHKALNRSDIIITSGGLGPTTDDITREVVSEATGNPLYEDKDLRTEIENYFHEKGYTLTPNNYRQAYLPRGAEPIINDWGTAPGILLEEKDSTIISLPGVPNELKSMLNEKVIPYLYEKANKQVKTRYLNFFGIGESTLETEIKDILENVGEPDLSLLAGKGEVRLRITASGNNENEINQKIKDVENSIKDKVGNYIYGINNKTLEEITGNILKDLDLSLSIAESCTGGLIGNKITNIPGCSDYFKGGIIAYSNCIKNKELKVSSKTLKKYGAVSRETAKEMATGVRKKFETDLGISVTGIAGPGGGTDEKPVGLVYIGFSTPENVDIYQLNLNGNRLENKRRTSQHVLNYLRKYLKNHKED